MEATPRYAHWEPTSEGEGQSKLPEYKGLWYCKVDGTRKPGVGEVFPLDLKGKIGYVRVSKVVREKVQGGSFYGWYCHAEDLLSGKGELLYQEQERILTKTQKQDLRRLVLEKRATWKSDVEKILRVLEVLLSSEADPTLEEIWNEVEIIQEEKYGPRPRDRRTRIFIGGTSTVGSILGELERQGLVSRSPDPLGRGILFRATPPTRS